VIQSLIFPVGYRIRQSHIGGGKWLTKFVQQRRRGFIVSHLSPAACIVDCAKYQTNGGRRHSEAARGGFRGSGNDFQLCYTPAVPGEFGGHDVVEGLQLRHRCPRQGSVALSQLLAVDDPVSYFLWNGGVDGRSSHDEIPFLGWLVFFSEMVDCLTSGRESGEAVGFEGKEVEDSTSLPPVFDFHETIHHMWPVDAFHRADDVVSVPDFCVSGGDVAEVDGAIGHVENSFSCLYPLGFPR